MDIVLRAVVAFVFLVLVMRVVGRRELGSMEPFDIVVLVVLGDLIQQGVTQSDYSLTGLAIAVSTFALLAVMLSWVSYRFRRLRPFLEGEPIVVLRDGKPIERNLRRERMTVEELQAEARKAQIASLSDVSWAVLETDGTISFIPRKQ
jgi:uncharacterized membrane protein YcaP (DUF421 family)